MCEVERSVFVFFLTKISERNATTQGQPYCRRLNNQIARSPLRPAGEQNYWWRWIVCDMELVEIWQTRQSSHL